MKARVPLIGSPRLSHVILVLGRWFSASSSGNSTSKSSFSVYEGSIKLYGKDLEESTENAHIKSFLNNKGRMSVIDQTKSS